MQEFVAAGGVPAWCANCPGCSTAAPDDRGPTLGEIAAAAPARRAAPSGRGPPARHRRGVRGGPRLAGPRRRGHQNVGGAARPASPPRPGRGVPSYDEMRARIEDPALEVTPTACWYSAAPGRWACGMPEWGTSPCRPTRGSRRRRHGAGDRWADERHSFGTCVPARDPRGGNRRPAGTGDRRRHDRARRGCRARSTWRSRPASWPARGALGTARPPHLRGWPALYRSTSRRPTSGCDFDFLRALRQHRGLFEPVVGRS